MLVSALLAVCRTFVSSLLRALLNDTTQETDIFRTQAAEIDILAIPSSGTYSLDGIPRGSCDSICVK